MEVGLIHFFQRKQRIHSLVFGCLLLLNKKPSELSIILLSFFKEQVLFLKNASPRKKRLSAEKTFLFFCMISLSKCSNDKGISQIRNIEEERNEISSYRINDDKFHNTNSNDHCSSCHNHKHYSCMTLSSQAKGSSVD